MRRNTVVWARAVCHFVWFLIRARNSRLRNLGIVPLLLCLAFCLTASSASFAIWSSTSPIVSISFFISVLLFAGLWQLIFAREKNFVNLTWDCILGNPINELSQIKVVCNHSVLIIYPPISVFYFPKKGCLGVRLLHPLKMVIPP